MKLYDAVRKISRQNAYSNSSSTWSLYITGQKSTVGRNIKLL